MFPCRAFASPFDAFSAQGSTLRLVKNMAEIAGLIIGGVSLSALFDQCISIINHVDSGMHCGDAYQDAALMLTLLGGCLGRWERAYRTELGKASTEEDGENAEHWLKQIRKRLQEAERVGERYTTEPSAVATASANAHSRAVSILVHRLQDKIFRGSDGLSLGQRTRWALRDEDKMNGLIDKLDRLITSLEQLFPGLQAQRGQIATVDASAVVGQLETEGYAEALEALKEAAARVDPTFNVAASSTSNRYHNIEIRDSAMVSNGNYYSEEWARANGTIGQGSGHDYNGIRVSGQAKVQNGDIFGGKNLFGA